MILKIVKVRDGEKCRRADRVCILFNIFDKPASVMTLPNTPPAAVINEISPARFQGNRWLMHQIRLIFIIRKVKDANC